MGDWLVDCVAVSLGVRLSLAVSVCVWLAVDDTLAVELCEAVCVWLELCV